MIPLRIPVEFEGGSRSPFVARLAGPDPDAQGEYDAHLVGELQDKSVFELDGGYLSIPAAIARHAIGDVILFTPETQSGHRWIRASSPHNTLLVTERCDQLCVMCSQPPKKSHTDMFGYFRKAVLLAPESMVIGLSGGEPTLFKDELFAFLEFVREKRPDLSFHVLTNAQHFDPSDKAWLVGPSRRNIVWGVPVYSSDAALHDCIVGKQGAFEALCDGLAVLGESGVSIELRTVLLKENVRQLPELSQFVSAYLPFVSTWALMQLENIGFARNRWSDLFYDNSVDFGPVGQAIDYAFVRGIDVRLFNFPLCTVPDEYRLLAETSISDWKQKFISVCSSCSAKRRCSGFFEWYDEGRGFERVGAL